MKVLQFTKFYLSTLLILVIFTSCARENSAFTLLPQEKEIELGKLYLPISIDEFEGLYPEERVQNYLQNLGKRIAQHAERKVPFNFYLVNSEVINAFALPGGPVVITRGIFLTLNSESELAGILAHEIGHIEKRHHAKFVEKQLALNFLLQLSSYLLPQNLTGELLFQLGQISAGLLSLKFSRDQEKEADETGFYLLLKAHYSPEGMLRVFEKFKKMSETRPPEWLSTHPLPETRIKEWEKKLSTLKPSGSFIKDSSSFQEILSLLKETQPSFEEVKKGKKALQERDYSKAEIYFLKAIELYPKNIPALINLSRLKIKNKDYLSARNYALTALKYNPDLFSGHYLAGLSEFALNNWKDSLHYFEKAKALVPFEGSTYYYCGRNYENLQNYPQALANYKKALEIGPKNASWYQDCYIRYQRLR
ncbi:MAG: M48 family metalloprotease [Caldimicrobium sp.]